MVVLISLLFRPDNINKFILEKIMSKILKNVLVLLILVLFTTGSAFAGGGDGGSNVAKETCVTVSDTPISIECGFLYWCTESLSVGTGGINWIKKPYRYQKYEKSCPESVFARFSRHFVTFSTKFALLATTL